MQKTGSIVKSWKSLFVWILFTLIVAWQINKRHQETGTFNWTTPMWADQAGYYVYLPSLFIYDFDAKRFPEKIEEKTGYGFSFDLEKNKVVTRYTCGIAILQAPFFLIIHGVAGILDQPQDGFSGIYHKVPDLSALFYCILGLYFLRKFLMFYYRQRTVWLTVLTLFSGTNLYYYAVESTGMSHVYSFALFAFIAWLSKMIISGELKRPGIYFIGWSFLFALIVLIRPTNVLLFPFLFCLDCNTRDEFWLRIKRFLTFRVLLVLSGSFLFVFLPQFLYWKYASGNYINDSYEGFGFSNWKSPKILELWFSPNNGLFLYSPLYLAAIAGLFLMIRRKLINGWVILITFLVATYVYASWFVFSFGCSFGSRNFVEYTVLFSLPLGYLFTKIPEFSIVKRYLVIALLVVVTLFNLRLVNSYPRCFEGNDWDFQLYRSFIWKLEKYHRSVDLKGSEKMLPENEYSKTIYLPVKDIPQIEYKKAVVKTRVKLEILNSEASLVLSVDTPDSTIYWNAFKLKDQVPDNLLHKNKTVVGEFWLPVPLPFNSTIAAYIWNKNKETLTLSKLELSLE
ncbi:MAG: hypothetical protein C0397_09625 [Odoribacter sp.]|nr:hypothetical protein [Odoribacter sp.]